MGCILWGRGHSLLLLALVALGGTALEGLAGKTGKYCQPDGRNIVLAIDTTTPYDDQDKDQLVRGVGEIVGEMQGGDRLAIRTITGSHIHSDHVFDRCRPGCAETSIWGSLLYCAEGMIQADDQKMKAEITHALRSRLANFIEQPRSDIIHTLVNASREEIQARPQYGALYILGSDRKFRSHVNSYHVVHSTECFVEPPEEVRTYRRAGRGRGRVFGWVETALLPAIYCQSQPFKRYCSFGLRISRLPAARSQRSLQI